MLPSIGRRRPYSIRENHKSITGEIMGIATTNHPLLFFHVLTVVCISVLFSSVFVKSSLIYPLNCSNSMQTCNSLLYHNFEGLSMEEVASFYSVNLSSIKPITNGLKQDYLVSVPCTCKDVRGTRGYFYDTFYRVQKGETFVGVTGKIYSGQAWKAPGEEELFVDGNRVSIHLACGCAERDFQEIVTYTVDEQDTLSGIAELLSTQVSEIENLNSRLTQNPSFIDVGWVLFVPREKRGIQTPKKGQSPFVPKNLKLLINNAHLKYKKLTLFTQSAKTRDWKMIAAIVSAVTLISISISILLLIRKRYQKSSNKASKVVTKCSSTKRTSLQSLLRKIDIEDATNSDRPVIYSLEEIDEATQSFDHSQKIGEGGYGSVFIGILKGQEVAIKKMKSSSSKEFFAELRALCKIHHVNVVELLGYASGDSHLYLVYRYIENGSLNDHLHDPLLKGYSPLSWTTRAHIALDAARGIEYIHDHMKERCVHCDIKTSNILLDRGLRAKVADFGLAKLVEQSSEEDFVATRLVGTPGYIAPESVSELQITSKTDVFAFGVVLAELIIGKRALFRESRETSWMKSLISIMYTIFQDKDPVNAVEAHIDSNLRGSYPIEEVHKMAELSRRCLSEDPVNRPAMGKIVLTLSQILISTIEWEALLAGSDEVFTGEFTGR
ncbi:lysM domain receptor-like kinase 3 [Tripterygium wilfordii]|uniref:lysM domain receptor-like kinase 3 n=1 Tax=Tripterygium wilfordii TaxID=458696 RepID=UPI0018F811F5|nr:lysM domain receptor-like kinase 3 [Tripterygium wilfordii]